MEDIDQQIIKLNEQNIQFKIIAKTLNCTTDKVRYTLQKFGCYVQKKSYNIQLDETLICDLYKQNISILEISHQFNVSTSPIKKILKKHNIMKPTWLKGIKYQYIHEILDKDFLYSKYCETYNKSKVAKYFECGNDLIDSAFKKHELTYLIGGNVSHAQNIKTAEYELTVKNVNYLYCVERLSLSEVAAKCKIGTALLCNFMKQHSIVIRNTVGTRYGNIKHNLFYNTSREDIIKIYDSCNNIYELTAALQLPYINHTKSLLQHHKIDLKLPDLKIKSARDQNISISKYGVHHYNARHILPESIKLLQNYDWIYNQYITENKTINIIAQELSVLSSLVYRYLKKHKIPLTNLFSTAHKEISDYLTNELNIEIINNTRKLIPPYEIDIYAPDYNIGIEINGIYWHSELAGKDKFYHLNKTNLCLQQGIQLIHITENEWILTSDIVKSRLCSIFKQIKSVIYARKCQVRELTNTEYSLFMQRNHIQGTINAKIKIGLVYNDVIVCVMSFGKSRFNKSYRYELYRFANILNTTVIGGASKIFSHFIKQYNPISIISYSDRRWSVGNMYVQIGFKYLQTTTANYYYFNNKDIYNLQSRQKYQKHKLSSILPVFDPNLTEWENMQNNGYNRIWDCGMDVWVYR